MAEEDSKPSKASRFLKKSKWAKVLKEREPSEDDAQGQAHQGAFTLNNDVVDFLKPSTEKSKPRLDIAIAKRWPEAHQVKASGEESPLPDRITFTKPKRRKGLTVGFAKTQPEIMGEGGDEAPDPPREIGRRKAAMTRSVSDARPDMRSPPLPVGPQSHRREPSLPQAGQDESAPPAIRRMNTSHNEVSVPVSRKYAPPPAPDVEPHRPSIGRVPTGFKNPDNEHTTPLDTPVTPQIDASQHADNRASLSDTVPSRPHPTLLDTKSHVIGPAGTTGDDAGSPVVQKRREINRSEGMAFRRASMLIHRNSEEDEDEAAPGDQRQSKASSAATHDQILSPSDYGQSPVSTVSADSPNPFADPKYTKRGSREISPAPPRSRYENEQPRQDRSEREFSRAEAPRPPPRSPLRNARGIAQPSPSHARDSSRGENSIRSRSPVQSGALATEAVAQQATAMLPDPSNDASISPRRPGRLSQTSSSSQAPGSIFTRPNGSTTSFNHPASRTSHSRTNSRTDTIPQHAPFPHSNGQRSDSPRSQNAGSRSNSPRSFHLSPTRAGPSPGPSPLHRPHDYSASTISSQRAKSPALALRQEEIPRPASTESTYSLSRPTSSQQLRTEHNPAADAAFSDFGARVAHMKGVFRLTAEKEKPADHCTPAMWLRAALWWYHIGKTGLEALFSRRDPHDRRELLTQPHVDLAKAWWILIDPLQLYDAPVDGARHSAIEGRVISRGVAALKHSLKMLSLSIAKNHLLPPEASLIQGQNTQIWIHYPRFTSDAAAALGGSVSKSVLGEDAQEVIDPYELLPLTDTKEFFWYGRFPVEVHLNTEDSQTDRVVLPCLLTVMRGKQDYQTSIAIASQDELVNIKISPNQNIRRGLTWADVSWQGNSWGMSIRLPRNFDLSVRMQERDFRALRNLCEHAHKVETALRADADERLAHQCRLVELQYIDSSHSTSFPTDKIRGCSVFLFERTVKHVDGSGTRKVHRGFRMLLITEPGHKTLSSVSHDICRRSPFFFELLTDSSAGGTTAMVVRIREPTRQCRMLLVFPDAGTRQALYDVVNGLAVSPDESILGKMALASLSIEPASQAISFAQSAHPALQNLQWQKLGVTGDAPEEENGRASATVESESLRILARHATGCITDRLNLGKGELLLRIPPVDSPSVQILREPQEDMTMSIDTRQSHAAVANGIAELLQLVQEQATIRTFAFQTYDDLHAFQAAITGRPVRYDGMAATMDISRRRMVVPIYKKWQAQNARIQIVSQGQITQLLAFMEEFSHADALCFQIKSTDVFEIHKGDSKGKKWTVKLVDAKFTLPTREKGKEESEDERRKNRFVNLENLDYAEEHDDITIGFDTEQERDRFAEALPAPATASRGLSLKRRT